MHIHVTLTSLKSPGNMIYKLTPDAVAQGFCGKMVQVSGD